VPVSKTGGCRFNSCLACLTKKTPSDGRRFSRKRVTVPKNKEHCVANKKELEKEKKPNAIQKWWFETVGELRRVNWPTTQDALRLTYIVLIVMAAMSLLLGTLDYIFSMLVSLLLA
jgi:preprotein translocase subunit SecE